jgi:hypothetical protein
MYLITLEVFKICQKYFALITKVNEGSVLPLPVGTGRPRPPLSKKSCDSDHEIMNLVEKNVGTPAILGRAL